MRGNASLDRRIIDHGPDFIALEPSERSGYSTIYRSLEACKKRHRLEGKIACGDLD